jgi:hypothetical protein
MSIDSFVDFDLEAARLCDRSDWRNSNKWESALQKENTYQATITDQEAT